MNAAPEIACATPCARCASFQRTCCQRAEILVTEDDVRRVTAQTGAAPDAFVERRRPVDPEYVAPDGDDPNWLRLTVREDGTRRMLRRQANGDCVFLGAAGCRLPLDARPLVCRLYPFAFTESGLDGVDADYCPTTVLAPHGEPMTAVLGMSTVDAERWRSQLYQELRDGQP